MSPWGIEAIHTYLPAFAVERKLLAEASGLKPLPGERSIAGMDEDPLTLGFSSAFPLREEGIPLFLVQGGAPLPLPYSLLALSLGVSTVIPLTGIRAGWELLALHPEYPFLLACTETRFAPWDDPVALYFSDGAGALRWGSRNPALVLKEVVREESYLRDLTFDPETQEDRFDPGSFSLSGGFADLFAETVKRLPEGKEALWLLSLPHPSFGQRLVNRFSGLSLLFTDFSHQGYVGAADPLFLLSAHREKLNPGTRVVLLTYSSGITALLFEVVRPLPCISPRHPQPLYRVTPYQWARFRNRSSYPPAPEEPPALEPRELKPFFMRLGFRCQACHTLTYPLAQSCISCGSSQGKTEPLAWQGVVFTYTLDHLHPSLFPPTAMIVAEMEGGGRIYLQGTDDLLHQVKIGERVELTLRLLHYGEHGKTPVYSWKLHGAGSPASPPLP